jgi:hypothetical protein
MSPDRDLQPPLESIVQHEAAIRHAGELLAGYLALQETPTLLLDMDGVVFEADSLQQPQLTTLDIIQTLQSLEEQGVAIGPATGRGMHVVEFLRNQGLQLVGPAILEEGQVIITDMETRYLGRPGHRAFMREIKSAMESHSEFVPTWDEVRINACDGRFTFCPGNFQWQGECRSSFWFYYHGDPKQDKAIVATRVEPILQALSPLYGLNYDKDVAVGVYRMKSSETNGNLAVIGIKGTLDGQLIDKGIAAKKMTGSWGFAADGFGDTPLAVVAKSRGGVVIGIEGNLDLTKDAPEFLQKADVTLRNPGDFTQALRYTANILHG